MKKRKNTAPVKPRKVADMREGDAAMNAFSKAMGQILNPLPVKKSKSKSK